MDAKVDVVRVAVQTVRSLDRQIENIRFNAQNEEADIGNAVMLAIRLKMLGQERIEAERVVKRNIQHTNLGDAVKAIVTPESWARILG